MKHLTRLPDAELEVMQALWAVGAYPASTAELSGRLEEKSMKNKLNLIVCFIFFLRRPVLIVSS